MIDLKTIRNTIIEGIENHLQTPVVRLNQNARPPKYDYIGYTITTLMKTNNGTYGEYIEDGKKVYRKEFQQIWSFTAYSDDDLQSKTLAMRLYDYLDKVGSIELSEKGIVIQIIGNITNRDNLLTIGYEYRNGFDVTLAFMNEIKDGSIDEIENLNFTYENNY